MNILFISKRSAYLKKGFGGAETSMKLLAEALAAKGHRVFYISRGKERRFLPRLVQKKVNGVKVIICSGLQRGRRFRFVRDLDQRFYESLVRRIVNKGDIDIAYCTYELPTMDVLFKALSVKPELKIVMRMAGMYWSEKISKDPASKNKFEKAFNLADCVNYIHQDQEQMVQEKLKELKMYVSFKDSFVADIGFSVGLKRGIPYGAKGSDNFTIINATRFSDYQKRQDILVKAASYISPEIKVNFRLIGDGREKVKIQAMVDRLNLTDRVTLIPFMSQEELWKEMISADLMCHACDYEGLGKVIIESMALGLPVLASNVATLNGYIEDGVNGFLVENGPELWARKIEALIEERELRLEVSRRSIEYVEENYSSHENVAQYEYHFQKILGNHSTR